MSCSGLEAASPVPSARIARPPLMSSSAAACFASRPGARSVTRATSVPTCRPGCKRGDGRKRGERFQRRPARSRRRIEDRREEVIRREDAVEPELRGARGDRERPGGIGGEHGERHPQVQPGASSTNAAAPTTPAWLPSAATTIGTSGRIAAASTVAAVGGPRRIEEQVARFGDAAGHHDDLRVEDVHEPGDPSPSQRPTSVEDRDRDGVAVPCSPGDHRPGDPAPVGRRSARARIVAAPSRTAARPLG